ncbi:MAG: cytochrome-c peroxidase [Azoarcus sp.]|jgi:cytochrome c peroxidase|nr:cytochrome-c peroxidase [Azoarcus sp.]
MNQGRLHFLLYGFLTLLAAGLVVTLVLPKDEAKEPASDDAIPAVLTEISKQAGTAILPIPSLPPEYVASGKVALGEKLFNDPRLSADSSVACASCHVLSDGGDDGLRVSVGVDGASGDVNAPTVFNSVFNFRQFWDGRAATLSEQVSGPLTNPSEMASNWAIAVRRVSEAPEYREDFQREYGGEISERTISDALVRFETTLVTPNAPFDRFLKGEADAIDADAKEGYRMFTDYGCISCHQGVNIGGNFFQRFGVMGDYFADRGNISKADLGRFNVTGQEEDRHLFKVPTLRNVAVTAPYFHDGSAATLDEAIAVMGRYQLGRDLTAEERHKLAAFLESLTGEYRGESLHHEPR